MSILLGIFLSVLTTFSDGTFHTQYETLVDASALKCNETVDSMIYYLQTDPKILSENFFVGLGMQDDKSKNAFYLEWKESSYNPENHYSKVLLDVLVDERPFLKNVEIESSVVDTMVGDRRDLRVDIYYAGHLLKQAYGTFHVMPIENNKTRLAMDVHVKFGWFFRIFISRKVYSETIDWRLMRFVQNIKLTAEGVEVSDDYWKQIDGVKKSQK